MPRYQNSKGGRMKPRPIVLLGVAALLVATFGVQPTMPQSGKAFSEEDFEVAFSFFAGGGTWAFRLAPAADPDKETTWKVMVLRQRGSTKTSFQLGPAELGPKSTISSAQRLLDLYAAPRDLIEFLRRYADRVEKGELEAYLLATPPVKQGESVPIKAAVSLAKRGLLDLLK
ncbi:MAG: hypothetical protein ACT4QD_06055 [Acidobacteriota bacterium]